MILSKCKSARCIRALPLIILLQGIISGNKVAAQIGQYEVTTIPLKGELVNFFGRCFLQDSEGFIWFGSEDGLYRYDGSGFKIFRNDPDDETSISDNMVQALLEDHRGTLWVGTYSGLNRFDKYTGTFKQYMTKWKDSASIENHRIDAIREDKEGYLWIATYTGFSRFDPETETFKNYGIKRDENSPNKDNLRIFDLYPDSTGYLWLYAESGRPRMKMETDSIEHIRGGGGYPIFIDHSGKFRIDKWGAYPSSLKKGTARQILYDPENPNHLNGKGIFALFEDRSGNFWIRTNEGIHGYNQKMERIFYRAHPHVYLWTGDYGFAHVFMEDNNGAIWYYTRDGINQIIPQHKNFEVYDPDPVQQSFIECVYVENKDLIWMGTLRGIFSLDRRTSVFTQHYGEEGWDDAEHAHRVDKIFKDTEGTLWVGMGYEGLWSSKPGQKPVQFKKHLPGFPDSLHSIYSDFYGVKHIFEDSNARVWISCDKAFICYYDRNEERFIKLKGNPAFEIKGGRYDLPNAEIRHETGSGILWAVGWAGVFKYITPFIRASDYEVMPSGIIRCFGIDGNGLRTRIPHAESSYLDDAGDLWLATPGSGLVKLENPSGTGKTGDELMMTVYTTKNGLPHNKVKSIIADGMGNLWIGTEAGLAKFDPQNETFTNFYMRHGLPTNNFRTGSVFQHEDGELFFGTREGLISFFPDSVRLNQNVPPVVLTDLKINNEEVSPGNHSPLKASITYADQIDLDYNQDNLSFDFAILSYRAPDLNQYKYKLEGLNDDWVYIGNRTHIDFTNLKPGDYTLMVSGSNNDGIWNEKGASLQILIHPPPWQTWYAYLVYGLFLAGIILLYRSYMQNRARLRLAVEVEKMEKGKVLEMDQMRSRFFANISHEFRTPLTLIRGPLDEMAKNRSGSITLSRDLLDIMRRNTLRLQRLINQLLDLSKLETGNVRLRVAEGNLVDFAKTIIQSFLSLAESKKIKYTWDLPEASKSVYFDSDKLEKILTNLLSNAFKFTPHGGEVKIKVEYTNSPELTDEHPQPDANRFDASAPPEYALIKVSDSGKGIPPEKLEKIFDRFYQVSDSDIREEEGTGIGLALTKELVDLYGGKLRVTSQVGEGSEFSVLVPVTKQAFEEAEFISEHPGIDPTTEAEGNEMPSRETGTTVSASSKMRDSELGKPNILIVEDNTDLRNYISGNLGNEYQILMAENGEIGLELAKENIPDLIISDLMMPVMDGMEMCRLLKSGESTSHIPVVMLTAKADRDSKLEGLETGADDYLIKPFDSEELQIRVKNLIRQRELLREKFRNEFLATADVSKDPSPNDEMLKKILDTLRKHLSEPEFNMDRMSEELNMSRRQLFRKVNAVTGYAPNELLRNIRLKAAASLFRAGEKNISQVMYQVGFNNPSYFTRCFRELYQFNPSEFLKNHSPA
jgi:signal transduction histidine kinase/ligand-binding sensor domain-containing protein/DNA-binding response OmpR family regulator